MKVIWVWCTVELADAVIVVIFHGHSWVVGSGSDNFNNVTLAVWTLAHAVIVLVPLVLTLVAIDNSSAAAGVQVSAPRLHVVCLKILVRRKGCKSQAGGAKRSERQGRLRRG